MDGNPTKQKLQSKAAAPEGSSCNILSLPIELVADIAMLSGFFGAMSLKLTCKPLYTILSSKSSWRGYSQAVTTTDSIGRQLSSSVDTLESTVVISTQMHAFDHLLFGIWNSPNDDKTSTSHPVLYFEHVTFLEQYDYLGGIKLTCSKSGKIETEFFDHRETLPCYAVDLEKRTLEGNIPPVLSSNPISVTETGELQTFSGQVGGRRMEHSCDDCREHDSKSVLKDILIYEEISGNALWRIDGFKFNYRFSNGQSVTFHILQHGSTSMGMREELPEIQEDELVLDGKVLTYTQKRKFLELVS